MDLPNIIENLGFPYLCIRPETSPQDCLKIHEYSIAIIIKAIEEIYDENTRIDNPVMSIKRLREVDSSELTINSIIRDISDVTESILDTKTPALINNTAKLITECELYMKKVLPSILYWSKEDRSRLKTNLYSTIQNISLWTLSSLKTYELDFENTPLLDITVYEIHYKQIRNSFNYFLFLEHILKYNNRSDNLTKWHPNIFKKQVKTEEKNEESSSSDNCSDLNLTTKIKSFKDLEEVVSYSGLDECPVCYAKSFTDPETRFIINENPDCRHIICSCCMYNSLYTPGVKSRSVNTKV